VALNKPVRRIAIVGTGVIGASWAEEFLAHGFVTVEQIPCEASPRPHGVKYQRVKKQSIGHTLTLVQGKSSNLMFAPSAGPNAILTHISIAELARYRYDECDADRLWMHMEMAS
jgi:glycine/D-amino acid oxidase-like deaminating enzyme